MDQSTALFFSCQVFIFSMTANRFRHKSVVFKPPIPLQIEVNQLRQVIKLFTITCWPDVMWCKLTERSHVQNLQLKTKTVLSSALTLLFFHVKRIQCSNDTFNSLFSVCLTFCQGENSQPVGNLGYQSQDQIIIVQRRDSTTSVEASWWPRCHPKYNLTSFQLAWFIFSNTLQVWLKRKNTVGFP